MPTTPRAFDHPTFGPCEPVPSLAAIRWASPVDAGTAAGLVSDIGLSAVGRDESPQGAPDYARRDPTEARQNASATLTWVSGRFDRAAGNAALDRAAAHPRVAWVGLAYRATGADEGPQSYFTVNPTVLLVPVETFARLGYRAADVWTARIDERRSQLLKGYVVLNIPEGEAIQLADQVNREAAAQGLTGGAILENIPYLSPTTGCGCGGGHAAGSAGTDSTPCVSNGPAVIPNDPLFAQQWGLERISAPRAWAVSEGDPNVVVAVLDQGVELLHPDLNVWPVSYSTVTHTNDGSPVGNHGTACAGIIAGRIDNALGPAGLAGKCRVMAIATDFADTEVAEGLYFAADNGARVVSMSFGVYPSWGFWNFALIEAALQYCQDRNVVLVAATGNENQNVSRFPGSDPRTIGVGGSNRDDVRKAAGDTSIEPFWGACYGPSVDVVAPCLEIPTTDRLGAAGYTPTDYDLRFNGTSSATPHVAALAGLVISVNPALSNTDVRRIISESTDKINAGGYTYLPTAGKPYGTWTDEVGYGRINAERAVLVACSLRDDASGGGCGADLPTPEACCVSPCDPPWRPDEQCLIHEEVRFFRAPLGNRDVASAKLATNLLALKQYVEFRISYEHRLCLLGKQHGPLIYTVTLLPGEKINLYHSDRYRRITSEQDRFSVQSTFTRFLSVIHDARVTSTLDSVSDRLTKISAGSSFEGPGGLLGAIGSFFGLPSGSSSSGASVTSQSHLRLGFVSDQFNQSVSQASQMTNTERSIVVSTYEDKDTADITARSIQNDNACRAVTYFVRRVMELYAVSTRVSDISYRIIAPNVPPEWHSSDDVAWLPAAIRAQIRQVLGLLPRVGDVVERPKPVSVPTDGTVYDPELAHCCSCEPEREAAITIGLERQQADVRKARFEAELLELELERRRKLLQAGNLAPFEPAPAPDPAPTP